MTKGKASSSKAYWELVGAILTAARLVPQRPRPAGARARNPAAVSLDTQAPLVAGEGGDDLALLRDFLSGRGVKCPHCRAEVELRSAEPVDAGAAFDAHLTCHKCHRAVTRWVATDDLLRWLHSDN